MGCNSSGYLHPENTCVDCGAHRSEHSPTAYTIELTAEDVRTIAFVGGRYGWSAALSCYDAGTVELTEPEAWEIADAFEADQDGGHSAFPMLNYDSELADKLIRFWDSIV